MSEAIPIDDYDDAYGRALDALRAGELVVLPTDTVYAVVADAFDSQATERLRTAKRRDRTQPFSVVIRSPRQVTGMVSEVPETAERLMAAYWPGPLTVVFRAVDGLTWDLGETRGTVGLRMPVDDLCLALIAEIGPLACTGANRGGATLGTTADEVRDQLGTDVAVYVDGGPRAGPPSTIVDVTGTRLRVLRRGAVRADHIRKVANGVLPWGQQPSVDAPKGDDRKVGSEPADTGVERDGE